MVTSGANRAGEMWFHRGMDQSGGTRTRHLRWLGLLAFVAIVILAVNAVVVLRDGAADPVEALPVLVTVPPTTTTTAPPPEVPVSTMLATPHGVIRAYDRPDGNDIGTVGTWYGRRMTMPIVRDLGEWLLVMRPERPNGSMGWIRRDEVAISSTAYRIVIRLPETRLYVYKDGFELFSAPVGIGKDSTPTAPGNFFVAIIEKPGPPGYGPVVLDTSGHSEAIQSWQGSGDAITSIHGSISARSAAQIGTTGTKISNGCIRMHHEDQLKLDVIPLGTPVDIIA